ncbi:hypothetical protein MKX08_006839 [Trichoderma sp. CBMAI-0020]|nr:hypothetical protein MKX08_006839 [Trichoderma sp. CBMAI-0020]
MTGLGHSHTEDGQSAVYLTGAAEEARSNAVSVTCCSSFYVMPKEDHHEGGPKQGNGRWDIPADDVG